MYKFRLDSRVEEISLAQILINIILEYVKNKTIEVNLKGKRTFLSSMTSTKYSGEGNRLVNNPNYI